MVHQWLASGTSNLVVGLSRYGTHHAKCTWRNVGMLAVERRRNGNSLKRPESGRALVLSDVSERRSKGDRWGSDRFEGTTGQSGRPYRSAADGPTAPEDSRIRHNAVGFGLGR